MLTMAPPPLSRINGTARCVIKNGPLRLTAKTRCQSLKLVSPDRPEDRDAGIVDQRIEPPKTRG